MTLTEPSEYTDAPVTAMCPCVSRISQEEEPFEIIIQPLWALDRAILN